MSSTTLHDSGIVNDCYIVSTHLTQLKPEKGGHCKNRMPPKYCLKSTKIDGTPTVSTSLKDEGFRFRRHCGTAYQARALDGIGVGPVFKVPTLPCGFAEANAAPLNALLEGHAGVEDVNGKTVHLFNASANSGLLYEEKTKHGVLYSYIP